ncbi:hypothetical protein FB451DRAFT_1415522 [Mycena latifolia]|nr:hypothetical protein FB451DRAFT_1415522 [Mycena latifolia]
MSAAFALTGPVVVCWGDPDPSRVEPSDNPTHRVASTFLRCSSLDELKPCLFLTSMAASTPSLAQGLPAAAPFGLERECDHRT